MKKMWNGWETKRVGEGEGEREREKGEGFRS